MLPAVTCTRQRDLKTLFIAYLYSYYQGPPRHHTEQQFNSKSHTELSVRVSHLFTRHDNGKKHFRRSGHFHNNLIAIQIPYDFFHREPNIDLSVFHVWEFVFAMKLRRVTYLSTRPGLSPLGRTGACDSVAGACDTISQLSIKSQKSYKATA